ncbi:MAG: BMP family ABC transporter substrate-binding protein [Anaerolineales bacterium]|nr:BMP family ABC transporter substrate-binding protein [Anaerolineales bacterium]
MKQHLLRLASGVLLVSLALAACTPATQAPPTATTAPTAVPAVDKKICEVTDTGGVDDKSFNQLAYAGVQQVQTTLGWEGSFLESQQQTDYEKNINEYVQSGCDLIVTVGFLLGDATKAAAEANPDQKIIILDYAYDPALPNVWGQVYAVNEAAFLAGYVAASATKTGKVGTFGGINIPPVVDFMDGFAYGVAHYNEKHGAAVEVLGWDPADREGGLFTGNFDSTDDGRRMAETLMDEGADIILPVAGPVGLGTLAAVQERGSAWVIWVDVDGTISAPEYKSIILTSILKKLDVTVVDAAKAVDAGTFAGGTHVANLQSGGVDIAPFYDLSSMVPSDVQGELAGLRAEIIAGTLPTKP